MSFLKSFIKSITNRSFINEVDENFIQPYWQTSKLGQEAVDNGSLFEAFQRVAQSYEVAKVVDLAIDIQRSTEYIDPVFHDAVARLNTGDLYRAAVILSSSNAFQKIKHFAPGWARDITYTLEKRIPEEYKSKIQELNL